jgi:type IV pilus assembly protein PilP
VRTIGVLTVALVSLAGCGGGDMGDLQSYVQQVLARKGKRPPPIPPLEPYVVYSYQSGEGRDPFEPFFKEEAPAPAKSAAGNGVQPDLNRNREELEQYALDSLRMMGTLEQKDKMWGIVRSPDGTIHRVQVGNYMGRNFGKIVNISEERIELNEIVPDGQGGWTERQAALALVEQ